MSWYIEPHRTSYVGIYQTVQELRQEECIARTYGWQLVSVIRTPVGLEATFVRVAATG